MYEYGCMATCIQLDGCMNDGMDVKMCVQMCPLDLEWMYPYIYVRCTWSNAYIHPCVDVCVALVS